MAKELVGKKIGGWTVRGYVNNGKSAVILRGTRSKKEVALKIFDPDLMGRFGREAQLARVEREKNLIGKWDAGKKIRSSPYVSGQDYTSVVR